jgi:hypothetical protein
MAKCFIIRQTIADYFWTGNEWIRNWGWAKRYYKFAEMQIVLSALRRAGYEVMYVEG